MKELEVGLSSTLASKAHTEAKSKDAVQRLEAKLKAAEAARAQAEADLMSFKERMDVARGRVRPKLLTTLPARHLACSNDKRVGQREASFGP